MLEAPNPQGASGREWCYVEPQVVIGCVDHWIDASFLLLAKLVMSGVEAWAYCGASNCGCDLPELGDNCAFTSARMA